LSVRNEIYKAHFRASAPECLLLTVAACVGCLSVVLLIRQLAAGRLPLFPGILLVWSAFNVRSQLGAVRGALRAVRVMRSFLLGRSSLPEGHILWDRVGRRMLRYDSSTSRWSVESDAGESSLAPVSVPVVSWRARQSASIVSVSPDGTLTTLEFEAFCATELARKYRSGSGYGEETSWSRLGIVAAHMLGTLYCHWYLASLGWRRFPIVGLLTAYEEFGFGTGIVAAAVAVAVDVQPSLWVVSPSSIVDDRGRVWLTDEIEIVIRRNRVYAYSSANPLRFLGMAALSGYRHVVGQLQRSKASGPDSATAPRGPDLDEIREQR